MRNKEQEEHIKRELTPMIERAEKEGLLFEAMTPLQDIVITARELKKRLSEGMYSTWDTDHWQLITYNSYRELLIHKVSQVTKQLKELDIRYIESIPIDEKDAIMLLGLSWDEFKQWIMKVRSDETIYSSDLKEFKKLKDS